mmetsp:Transcript_60077/g.141744  ORF Transcript_60077/g.141744 Transcript_60077/m.141744 type:complete len:440 (-) Transcript_60077:1753-3072(-)
MTATACLRRRGTRPMSSIMTASMSARGQASSSAVCIPTVSIALSCASDGTRASNSACRSTGKSTANDGPGSGCMFAAVHTALMAEATRAGEAASSSSRFSSTLCSTSATTAGTRQRQLETRAARASGRAARMRGEGATAATTAESSPRTPCAAARLPRHTAHTTPRPISALNLRAATRERMAACSASFALNTSSSCFVIFGFSPVFFLAPPSSLASAPYSFLSSLLMRTFASTRSSGTYSPLFCPASSPALVANTSRSHSDSASSSSASHSPLARSTSTPTAPGTSIRTTASTARSAAARRGASVLFAPSSPSIASASSSMLSCTVLRPLSPKRPSSWRHTGLPLSASLPARTPPSIASECVSSSSCHSICHSSALAAGTTPSSARPNRTLLCGPVSASSSFPCLSPSAARCALSSARTSGSSSTSSSCTRLVAATAAL